MTTALEKAREALTAHHQWHLAQTEPDQHGIIGADAYAESEMCDKTLAALAALAALDAAPAKPSDAALALPDDAKKARLFAAVADLERRRGKPDAPLPAPDGWEADINRKVGAILHHERIISDELDGLTLNAVTGNNIGYALQSIRDLAAAIRAIPRPKGQSHD